MLVTAVVFFFIAAFLGTFLLRSILENKRTNKPVVFMHGSVAGLALLALATYIALGHTAPLLITSVVLFVLAAIGGLTMFTLDTSGKRVPKMLAIGHPMVAVSAIVVLIVYIVQSA
ncbi:MAG TPA: hypothetical protein VLJ15_02950 [Gammaproteobacteria bacterium]|nr:hypothetical protein [Gammaproteobacteria bacterium]